MSPPRPLAAFKWLCAAATRFISHSVLSVRESLCRVADMTETAAAEAAPPAVPAAKSKAPKKKTAAVRSKAAGPNLGGRIDQLVADCHDRQGMSLVAIKKGLAADGVDLMKSRRLILLCIRKRVANGVLVQNKGSFKTGKGEAAVKPIKKAKVPAAKTPKSKKPTAKKTPIKKSLAKATTKKPTVKKPPAKKPAAKKTAAKKVSPKKASPKKTQKVAAKKAANKPVKRPAKPKSAKPKKAATKR
ncbi:uncharacterized protein LOC144609455 [Rhinoraja longicauda]